MKKIMNWSIFLLIILSLSACAGMEKKNPFKVKCPSCGYEFGVDPHDYGR